MDKREQTKRWAEDTLKDYGRPFSDFRWIDHEDGGCVASFVSNEHDKTWQFDRITVEAIAAGDLAAQYEAKQNLLRLFRM